MRSKCDKCEHRISHGLNRFCSKSAQLLPGIGRASQKYSIRVLFESSSTLENRKKSSTAKVEYSLISLESSRVRVPSTLNFSTSSTSTSTEYPKNFKNRVRVRVLTRVNRVLLEKIRLRFELFRLLFRPLFRHLFRPSISPY